MRNLIFVLSILILCSFDVTAQTFSRSELPTPVTTPWEITYGPDGFLWLTESGGIVSRVDPATGAKTIVYTAPDYFGGSPLEQLLLCSQPNIGSGTLGLALHPDFMNPSASYVYYVYSYNNGTSGAPSTKFKIVRLYWDATQSAITGATDLVTDLPNGYDHLGGRLMAINRTSINYLFYTAGDNGVSEENNPTCYNPQSTNPNNFTQDINYRNGKIHRFNIDGTIPFDNPVAGNSIYTRGHRNPQGLMYHPGQDILYDIEHGNRTDDEINILESGHNYGWKNVRGYHADNNFPGEAAFVAAYVPDPGIAGDALTEPLFSWCDTPLPASSNYLDWCTVAPSDGIYYGSIGIPEWTNSLLVVTLKDGLITDEEVFCFRLQPGGNALIPSTTQDPNPRKYFGNDQALNGRLRDIAVSPDGLKIFLINNYGANVDKITVYTYTGPSSLDDSENTKNPPTIFPNPAVNYVQLSLPSEEITSVKIISNVGAAVLNSTAQNNFDIAGFAPGVYCIMAATSKSVYRFIFMKQ